LSPAVLDRAHCYARNAVQLDRSLPQGHAQLGYVLAFEAQHELAIAEFERAFELNPNYTDRALLAPSSSPASLKEPSSAFRRTSALIHSTFQ
jgi:tetratricopeptide (TPR) repeat protein